MMSVVNNFNEIFNIIEHKISLLEDLLLIIKNENQKILLENILINQKIDKLELNIIKKDIEIKELQTEKLKNKILSALSDIINNENLENKISEVYDDLIYLKKYIRTNDIITANDNKDIKNKKILVTIDVLKNLSDEIKNEIISDFDNDIIEKIIDYYEKNKLFINYFNISKKELNRINNWWK
jgi:hypothetical protein